MEWFAVIQITIPIFYWAKRKKGATSEAQAHTTHTRHIQYMHRYHQFLLGFSVSFPYHQERFNRYRWWNVFLANVWITLASIWIMFLYTVTPIYISDIHTCKQITSKKQSMQATLKKDKVTNPPGFDTYSHHTHLWEIIYYYT